MLLHVLKRSMRCCCAASAPPELHGPLQALEDAGCFALVLECLPNAVSAAVTSELSIPTIGIGAGGACSGQVTSQCSAAAAEVLGHEAGQQGSCRSLKAVQDSASRVMRGMLAGRAATTPRRQCSLWQLQEQGGSAVLGRPSVASMDLPALSPHTMRAASSWLSCHAISAALSCQDHFCNLGCHSHVCMLQMLQ